MSAIPVRPRTEVGGIERFVVYPLLYRFFGHGYADMARMEAVLRASNVDWTVVRPPMLTNRHGTGRYRTAIDQRLRGGRTICRGDLAIAMLDMLDEPRAVRGVVEVAA